MVCNWLQATSQGPKSKCGIEETCVTVVLGTSPYSHWASKTTFIFWYWDCLATPAAPGKTWSSPSFNLGCGESPPQSLVSEIQFGSCFPLPSAQGTTILGTDLTVITVSTPRPSSSMDSKPSRHLLIWVFVSFFDLKSIYLIYETTISLNFISISSNYCFCVK